MSNGLFDDLPVQKAAKRTGVGRPRLRTAERGQVELRAVSLDDLVPADHRVRLVWRFVEGLDLSALMAAGVAGLERVAQDGVRVRASVLSPPFDA